MSLVTEAPGTPLFFFNGTADPKTNASNPNLHKIHSIAAIITREIVFVSIVSRIEISIICLAIYAVYSLIKSKQTAPVFIINLLIPDLMLIFSIVTEPTRREACGSICKAFIQGRGHKTNKVQHRQDKEYS